MQRHARKFIGKARFRLGAQVSEVWAEACLLSGQKGPEMGGVTDQSTSWLPGRSPALLTPAWGPGVQWGPVSLEIELRVCSPMF